MDAPSVVEFLIKAHDIVTTSSSSVEPRQMKNQSLLLPWHPTFNNNFYYNGIDHIIDSRQDRYTRDLITYYLTGVVGVTLCCLGSIGNVLSIIVLSRKSMSSSTFGYLLALSCCDFMALLSTGVLVVKDLQNKPDSSLLAEEGLTQTTALLHLFPYLNALACTFQVISIWLTLAFTVDRYIMICHPFKAKRLCRISRARRVIAFLYLAGFAFNFPKFFEYKTEDISIYHPLQGVNVTISVLDLTDFGQNYVFRQLYHFWFYIVVVCGIPFMLLTVLNACLINTVVKSRQVRRFKVKVVEKKNDTTVMLIAVVLIFFVCQMPALVSRSIWAAQSYQHEFMKTPLFTLNEIANLLVVFNSAVNIIPYYCFSVRYRRVFLNLFCCCLPRFHQPVQFIKRYSFSSSKGHRIYGSMTLEESRKNSSFVMSPRNSLQMIQRGSTAGLLHTEVTMMISERKRKRNSMATTAFMKYMSNNNNYQNKWGRKKKSIHIDVFGDLKTEDSFSMESESTFVSKEKLKVASDKD